MTCESASGPPVLQVDGLEVRLTTGQLVVQDVALTLRRGETLALVGESGSGKTTTAQALLGYARRGMEITNGRVELCGQVLDIGDEHSARTVRGSVIAHVPQDPATSLNPS